MVTVLKKSVISTVKIEGEFQTVCLLPMVFVVGDDGWKHSCPQTTRGRVVLQTNNAPFERKTNGSPKRRKGPFRIDENIRTMVQITSERESMDNDNNCTDEEKLRNQMNQSDSIESNRLLQNHQICQNLAVVDDTNNFLAMDKLPFIEVDGKQMSSWIDVKELLFPKCSEPNCCDVLNCLMKMFLKPPNLNLMHPCSEKEHKLFLRQFKLVFQGCMLVSLPEVKKRLDILQAEVEIVHLEKTGKEACSYLQTTCSKCSPQRPKTSLPRQRNPSDRRPKSADKILSDDSHLISIYDKFVELINRLAVVPILLVPKKIRELKQYGRSTHGPEADGDDIHFPVLLHYGQEKITVPCAIIARVFPQSYNVLLHCLLTTTISHRQHEQFIFSACSSHQAFSFNRWISKYLKDSNVHGVTTGSLLINLEKFSELTYDLLPLSTTRILQSKCRWPDLTEENFKNIVIWDRRPCPLLKKISHSTCQGNADRNSPVSDFNYNARTVTSIKDEDVVRDHHDNESGEESAMNGIDYVKNKVYDNKPYLPLRTRGKGVLRVRPVSTAQTTNSSKKSFRVKPGSRKISKSGLAKSPYLSQPVAVKNGTFFSKRLQIEKTKFGSVRPRSQVTDNSSRKQDLYPKAFIASPPSVLRVNSPTKDVKVTTPYTLEESSASRDNDIQCAQIRTVVDTSCVVPYNPKRKVNENERNKSKPGMRHFKRNDLVSLKGSCDIEDDLGSPFTTAVLLANGINLQDPTKPQLCPSTHLQEEYCLITDDDSITIPSSEIKPTKSNVTEETRETRKVASKVEKDQESTNIKPGVFEPVPSWQQLNLQLDSRHPYDDVHKMFQLPRSSAGKSSTNVPGDDISMPSSSVYTSSGSNSLACGILERNKGNPLAVDASYTTLSPTNSSSMYSSDETNNPVPGTLTQIEKVSKSPPLRVDGLIEALETIQATAPKSTLENILTGRDLNVLEEKTVIDLASEVMKSNLIQNQPVSPPRPVATSPGMFMDANILQKDSRDEAAISLNSSEICVCEPSNTTCDLPFERNRQYIQIVNSICNFKDVDPPKLTYTRNTISKSPYKGSALKLNTESGSTKTLQNAIRHSKLLNNKRSLLTPELLNISRFHSLGNVLVINSTNDVKAANKSAKMDRKDDFGIALQPDIKVRKKKRVEHIKIINSIPLRRQCGDKVHTQGTNQIPSSSGDYIRSTITDGKNESVPGLDLGNFTQEVSRTSVRVQYDVKPSKSFGTGHFLHNKTKMNKGMHVRHTMPIAKNQFNSTLKKPSPKVFQEIVTNKSSFRKPSFQNYFSTIPSESDYQIPPSSPNGTSQDSDVINSQFQSCKNELNFIQSNANVSEQEQCDSSASCKSGRVIRQKYEDGPISVLSVHDSINNQLKVHDGFHRKKCSQRPKRNQASIPLENMNRLEDNLSIMSLYSSREKNIYNSIREATKSEDRKTKTVHNRTELNLSKVDLPVAREMIDPNTSSNVVNVIFQYGPKHNRIKNDDRTLTKSRHYNGAILDKTPEKSLSHYKQNSRKAHQKLRICIDLVGSSDETSPLEIKKLVKNECKL